MKERCHNCPADPKRVKTRGDEILDEIQHENTLLAADTARLKAENRVEQVNFALAKALREKKEMEQKLQEWEGVAIARLKRARAAEECVKATEEELNKTRLDLSQERSRAADYYEKWEKAQSRERKLEERLSKLAPEGERLRFEIKTKNSALATNLDLIHENKKLRETIDRYEKDREGQDSPIRLQNEFKVQLDAEFARNETLKKKLANLDILSRSQRDAIKELQRKLNEAELKARVERHRCTDIGALREELSAIKTEAEKLKWSLWRKGVHEEDSIRRHHLHLLEIKVEHLVDSIRYDIQSLSQRGEKCRD